jgi:hypothetical protein
MRPSLLLAIRHDDKGGRVDPRELVDCGFDEPLDSLAGLVKPRGSCKLNSHADAPILEM